ncbi:trehalose-phosphatase [Burkholderia pseudomallei]|nr:trehalose-phosphatase [Burkholderia pseudomallei]
MQSIPLSLPLSRTAFFFDFDGTLVDLAPTPDAIQVPPDVPVLVDALRQLSHGAVAIVSGRGIDSIDAYLNLPGLPVAGLHGAERRDANGDTQRIGFDDPRLLRIERELAALVDRHPGMLLEIKGAALALHFRNAPEREGVARARRPSGSSPITRMRTCCSRARWCSRSSRRASTRGARLPRS